MTDDELIARLREAYRKRDVFEALMSSPTAADRIEALVDEVERLTKERDEALNQLDSARYSVEVLEKRVAHFMARAEAAEAKVEKLVEALQEIATDEHPLGWIAIAAMAEFEGDQK